jgi:hypothetical protein
MNNANEQRAYFTVTGDFDPEEISLKVGASSSRSWKKGEINSRTGLERKASRWSLDSRVPTSEPLEAHVRDVLQQLLANRSEFAAVSESYGGVVQVVGYFYTSFSGFGLAKADIDVLSTLGLELDCDFYYLSSSGREDS